MDKKAISVSHSMKGGMLDDDYTLFDDGTVLHEYDRSIYPNGINLKEELAIDELSDKIKQKLLDAAMAEDKEIVRKILKLY